MALGGADGAVRHARHRERERVHELEVVAVVLGMVLVFVFVRRELGHPGYGLIAMALFGITSQYAEAVRWFAASFAILALDTILLALLAAQRWRQTGRARHLAWAALWSALAPCWFASGILAGPLCFLYLLPTKEDRQGEPTQVATWIRQLALATVPVLGTVLFLAVTLPRNAAHIMHLEHYKLQHKTAVQAFQLDIGLAYTARSLVERATNEHFGRWLEENPDVFDFVVADFPDPSSYAIGKLYSTGFYRLLARHLSARGRAVAAPRDPRRARSRWGCASEPRCGAATRRSLTAPVPTPREPPTGGAVDWRQ